MSYRCKYFSIEELVSPAMHKEVHEEALWCMFDTDALKAIDWLRERYGAATINNWKWGGDFTESGLRTRSDEYYSEGSQHSRGAAFDIKFKYVTAQHIRDDLAEMELRGEKVPYIKRIENDVSWLHIDTMDMGRDSIYFFNP